MRVRDLTGLFFEHSASALAEAAHYFFQYLNDSQLLSELLTQLLMLLRQGLGAPHAFRRFFMTPDKLPGIKITSLQPFADQPVDHPVVDSLSQYLLEFLMIQSVEELLENSFA